MTPAFRLRLLLCLTGMLAPLPLTAQDAGVGRTPDASDQVRSGGSSVPCALPLRWRLADIDPRFGLSADAAEVALRAAFRLWESAADATLFEVDEAGHPVSFVFDERQVAAQRRQAEREAAAAHARDLENAKAAFAVLEAAGQRLGAAYEEVAAGHGARVRRLNEEIALWNQRSPIPDTVQSRLEGEREDLVEIATDLDDRRRDLRASNEGVTAAWRQLNEQIEEYNRTQERLARASAGLTQAGRYDEEVTTRAGRVEEVRRRIRVFRYDSAEDLVFVLAHELGHALGLGHASRAGALMSEVSTFDEGAGPPGLHPRDVAMLDARCPGLRDP